MTLTPPDTWSNPTFGLACLMSSPISPKLVLFPDFEFRTSLGTSVLLKAHHVAIYSFLHILLLKANMNSDIQLETAAICFLSNLDLKLSIRLN